MVILAGEFGGEKTKLAFFSHRYDETLNKTILVEQTASKSFDTMDYAHQGLENIIDDFVREFHDEKEHIYCACFGVPAQVKEGSATIKRLGQEMSLTENACKQKLPSRYQVIPVKLINDMVAIGYGMFLGKGELELEQLYEGENEKEAKSTDRRSIMLVSDGLGQSLWKWAENEEALSPTSSEGGHCRFAAQTAQEWELCLYIKKEIQKKLKEKGKESPLDKIKVRFENVLSRKGLVTIYTFLRDTGTYGEEPSNLREKIQQNENNLDPLVKDIVRDIIENAIPLDTSTTPNDLCMATLEMFITIWGERAGDLGITFEAKGGVYIGGISLDMTRLKEGLFVKAFLEKDIENSRNYENNINIPLKIFKEEDIVLLGSARYIVEEVPTGKFALMAMG